MKGKYVFFGLPFVVGFITAFIYERFIVNLSFAPPTLAFFFFGTLIVCVIYSWCFVWGFGSAIHRYLWALWASIGRFVSFFFGALLFLGIFTGSLGKALIWLGNLLL
jgi:hypothetical protein